MFSLQDVLYWLNNAKMPNKIFVKGNTPNKTVVIEVSFDVELKIVLLRKNRKFINKTFYVNEEEMKDLICAVEKIKQECLIETESVWVLATTEHNDPKLFNKIMHE